MIFNYISHVLIRNHQIVYVKFLFIRKLNLRRNNSIFTNMSNTPNLLKPPECVYGMKELDRNLFKKTVDIPCLHIKNIKISAILPRIKKYLLKIENFKPIVSNNTETFIYLNPELTKFWTDISQEDQEYLTTFSVTADNFQIQPQILGYENFSLENTLKSILPHDQEGLSSFTKTGHIVHVNLREHLLPYKNIIGEVLYDKVPNCKTVVNKINMIDTTYRNFQMEILKGEDIMITQVKENKCVFEFDFSKVYWNSRLCTEHERIVKMIQRDDVVFDIFAGVGPFSIPLAKKRCTVYANDLNPESYNWLNHNKKINKINDNYIKTYNQDGKDFILNEIKQYLPLHINKKQIYIIMNLPALAVEFLPNLIQLFTKEKLIEFEKSPLVVVYCFTKGENYMDLARDLLFKSIGYNIADKIVDIFRVRTVSSLKEMMRIIFRLDRDLLVGNIGSDKNYKRQIEDCCSDQASKKCNILDLVE